MGFIFRKTKKIGKNTKLNTTKNGVGVSTGVKGARVSLGADGKVRLNLGIPGTGIRFTKTLNKKKKI